MSALLDALNEALRQEWPDAPAGAHARVAERLCGAVGGARCYLPRRAPGEAAARVLAALAAGATVSEAAAAGDVTARHARRLRART